MLRENSCQARMIHSAKLSFKRVKQKNFSDSKIWDSLWQPFNDKNIRILLKADWTQKEVLRYKKELW